ncbi:MAG: DUF1573 domain-containing protein [Candidatus Niyogibacteria bacterium]|nr:DUF1573 domain-containing protein [Candidatus Niyogibacteria bacterium]
MIKKFSELFGELWPYLALALLFGAVLALGMLGGPRSDAKRAATPGLSASALSAEETLFDFGTIAMGNGKVEHEFILKNDGKEALTVTSVLTSCMCTNAFLTDDRGKSYGPFGMSGHGGATGEANINVAPGASVKLRAVFDPAAHGPAGVGVIQRSIYLETSSAKSPRMELKFHAVVTN